MVGAVAWPDQSARREPAREAGILRASRRGWRVERLRMAREVVAE